MPRPADDPVASLRGALRSPIPAIRAAAERAVASAIRRSATVGEIAERLHLPRRGLERLRADFPDVFSVGQASGK